MLVSACAKVGVIAAGFALTGACTANPSADSGPATPATSATVLQARITRCADVKLPNSRYYKSYFHADGKSGLMDMRFESIRPGAPKHIEYTVRYQTDQACHTRPMLAALMFRVTPEGVGSAPQG
jgi:hypothetical protein